MGLDQINVSVDEQLVQQRWISVYNASGEEIPPLSFVTPIGVAANGGIVVDQVTEDGDSLAMVTGMTPIPNESWGIATRDFPTRCSYDPDDGTPAVATVERWGPANGFWEAKKNKPGWFLIGPAVANMPTADLEIDSAMIELEVCRTT